MTATPGVPEHDQRVSRRFLQIAIAAVWVMVFFSFTRPGRPTASASTDPIALFKLASCGAVVSLAGWYLSLTFQVNRAQRLIGQVLPFGAFFVWSVLTLAWSPNKMVSVSQLISLLSLYALCVCTMIGCRNERDMARLFIHLCLAVFAVNALLLAVHLVNPQLSGLDRTETGLAGANGLIHPTAGGANAALCIMLAICGTLIWRERTIAKYFVPILIVAGAVLFFAASRTALVMVSLTIPLALLIGTDRREKGIVLLGCCAAAIVFMLVDPGFAVIDRIEEKVVDIARRGETAKQLATFNGRSAMWSAIWDEFKKSIVLGHGYAITSERGEFYMWQKTQNHSAHNLPLQILVSTGLIGAGLLTWAFAKSMLPAFLVQPANNQLARIRRTVLLIFVWYAGWTQLCISFMGPLRTESVVFFVLLGILIATWHLNDNAEVGRSLHHEMP